MINSSKDNSEGSLSTQIDSKQIGTGTKLGNCLNQCKFYEKIQFFSQYFEVGSNVYVKTQKQQADCVGKILRIMTFPQTNNTNVPLVEVQWYCTKYDIADVFKDYFEYFSEFELFTTELTNILFLDCILRSFSVLPLDEFDKLDEVPGETYFCRAQYNMKKQTFTPKIEEWRKTCVCQKPLNPDLLYIQCDFCLTWFHLQCVGVNQEQADTIEQYKCSWCKNKGVK